MPEISIFSAVTSGIALPLALSNLFNNNFEKVMRCCFPTKVTSFTISSGLFRLYEVNSSTRKEASLQNNILLESSLCALSTKTSCNFKSILFISN